MKNTISTLKIMENMINTEIEDIFGNSYSVAISMSEPDNSYNTTVNDFKNHCDLNIKLSQWSQGVEKKYCDFSHGINVIEHIVLSSTDIDETYKNVLNKQLFPSIRNVEIYVKNIYELLLFNIKFYISKKSLHIEQL